jgi:hypothetical protein
MGDLRTQMLRSGKAIQHGRHHCRAG